jgi:hypothetical protein
MRTTGEDKQFMISTNPAKKGHLAKQITRLDVTTSF